MSAQTADRIFANDISFEEKALEVFEFQKENNPVYSRFCKALGIQEVDKVSQIPLLPIQAFKDTEVITPSDNSKPARPAGGLSTQNSKLFFQSSGTSGMSRSRHYITDPDIYRHSILNGMQEFFELDEFVIWAYTPGYNENPNSSLIWMLNTLIEKDSTGLSSFLKIGEPLSQERLNKIKDSRKKLMLFGVAFGLLDIIEIDNVSLPEDSVIMETGGMKTHRREMSKQELHEKLATGFGVTKNQIHSEYGMTELLSQAYSQGSKWFECVPWMKVSIRDPENPMKEVPFGQEGLIGVIDLANIYSCSFILTGDKGIQKEDGKFQVLGRWNPGNLRGCNFLIDSD